MFGKDFFPTPENVILQMIEGYDLHGKTVLEPSAGKGNIVDVLKAHGAEVCACENNVDLLKILKDKCKIVATDFLKVTSEEVSHVDFIVMNPPFSKDEKHIIHAWDIAPAGCTVLALCNYETIDSRGYKERELLKDIIERHGSYVNLGNCFEKAERRTSVEVALVKLHKPAADYENEFEGFFMGDDEPELQANGLMPYNFVRDLVNRYVAAVKLFDEQMNVGVRMHDLIDFFISNSRNDKEIGCLNISADTTPERRNNFKKGLQKQAWEFVFDKMNLQRYATKGLREDINRFVEKQSAIPFTMRNIYAMLEIVIGTTEQRMDKAILEVFDKLTEHYHDNRFHVEGWKTNSHYLVNRRFIFPYGSELDWDKRFVRIKSWNSQAELLVDLEKALCFITGENWDNIRGISHITDKMTPGQWYYSHFLNVRGYKKGTIHCQFQSEDVWAMLNQRVCKIKGYPLPEAIRTKETDRRDAETAKRYKPEAATETTSTATPTLF